MISPRRQAVPVVKLGFASAQPRVEPASAAALARGTEIPLPMARPFDKGRGSGDACGSGELLTRDTCQSLSFFGTSLIARFYNPLEAWPRAYAAISF